MSESLRPTERLRAAIAARDLALAERAARELAELRLADALALTLLLFDEQDPRWDRAATRWTGRLLLAHPELGLRNAEAVARAFRDLESASPQVAQSQLGVLLRGIRCDEEADALRQWARDG